MSYRILTRPVHTLFIVTALTTMLSRCIDYDVGRSVLGGALGSMAWWACAWPLMLATIMMLVMGLPGGRRIVALPWRLGSDGWPLIIILASASSSTGVREFIPWPSLFADAKAELAILFLLLLCLIARILHLHFPERFGATPLDGSTGQPTIH